MRDSVKISVPEELVRATHMSPDELRAEPALQLYGRGKISLGKAAEVADMSKVRFQLLLAAREIDINYDVHEYEQDLATLREKGDL
jgi:predicted HTH domain antitoxin